MNEKERQQKIESTIALERYFNDRMEDCRTHCKSSFINFEKMMDIVIDAQDKALSTAKVEMDRRLESMNEFRSQLEKQAIEFVDKKEQKLIDKQQDDKIHRIEMQKATLDGKVYMIIIGVSAIVGGFVTLIVHLVAK